MKKRIMKDQGGFTLVELIVVLVILAILAAILVPALLGYIDKARNGQYLEEAHSIYTAIQVLEDEKYAKNQNPVSDLKGSGDADAVNALVDPTVVDKSSTTITCKATSGKSKAAYTVSTLKLKFTSQNGKTVEIDMDSSGNWGEPTIS